MTLSALPLSAVRRRAGRHRLAPWLYILPGLLTFVVWFYWPLIDAFRLSFFQWNMLPRSPLKYVGWSNYANLLALPRFLQAVDNTFIYLLGMLPLAVVLPLAIAIYTDDLSSRWRNIYRALIFVPLIVAPVVAASVWRWLLDPGHGIINAGLKMAGLGPVDFLNDPNIAIWTIIFITSWKLVGFSTLILAAANANINPSLIEAARMDGASKWKIVRDVRLPLLSPSILFLTMMTILLGAQWSFSYIVVLTQGGPLGSTSNIFQILWDFGFSSLSVGWSSAAAMILFVGFGIVALALLRLADRYSFYDN